MGLTGFLWNGRRLTWDRALPPGYAAAGQVVQVSEDALRYIRAVIDFDFEMAVGRSLPHWKAALSMWAVAFVDWWMPGFTEQALAELLREKRENIHVYRRRLRDEKDRTATLVKNKVLARAEDMKYMIEERLNEEMENDICEKFTAFLHAGAKCLEK
jgi:hypothetical protein